jgi:hypothetical protein
MKVDHIIWYESKEWFPKDGMSVLVSGGMAMRDGKDWISMTGTSVGRAIEWEVKYWAYLPQTPKE